jgi:hypothetical protein
MNNLFFATVFVAITLANTVSAQTSGSQPIQAVITAYLGVKNALTQDNGTAVQNAAKILYDAIDKVPMEKLSTSDHKVWMDNQEKLSYHAEHIKGTDELDHQREHFVQLSAYFYKIVKGMNENSVDLYYQFCPMANDGKGAYWVSESETISNPYFGKRMMKCGSTKETIPAYK